VLKSFEYRRISDVSAINYYYARQLFHTYSSKNMVDASSVRAWLERISPQAVANENSAPPLPLRPSIHRLTTGESRAEAADLLLRLCGVW
jgi:hypothetical protein